jgi:transcriptional regulator with XRE-family HTH domain
MVTVAHPVELNIPDQLKDRTFRQKFFLAESSARIAQQLIALRKKRGLNQQQVAEMIGTHQPAISRVEKADYQNWSFNTLRNIADALDARIRVYIEPSEDILREYENAEQTESPEEPELETAAAVYGIAPMSTSLAPISVSPGLPGVIIDNLFGPVRANTLSTRYTTNFNILLGASDNVQPAPDPYVEREKIQQLQLSLLNYAPLPGNQLRALPPDVTEDIPVFSAGQLRPQVRAT